MRQKNDALLIEMGMKCNMETFALRETAWIEFNASLRLNQLPKFLI
jgi:hypothetical protein